MKTSTNPSRPATATEFQIRHLTLEEIANPWLVIDRLFANTHLPALREGLWEWFKLTVSGTYTLQDPLERANLVYLYEEMERVIEAVWVMWGE